MIQYKIIKNFEELTKGDVLVASNNLLDTYEISKKIVKDDYVATIVTTMDTEYAEQLVKDGYAIKLGDEKSCSCSCCKLKEVEDFIDLLMEQYEKDHNSLVESFEDGCLQPCVKVEADTVYYNMQKLLKAIKNKINE